MSHIISHYSRLTENQLIKIISTLGLFISCWVMYLQHGWVNDDSVLYFEVAKLISVGQFSEAVSLYNWPFYSLLISIIHKSTSLNIQLSAQLLNAGFFTASCYFFGKLIQESGGDKKVILTSSALLFCSIYIVGDVLPMLLRDQGFWLFTLMSYVFFIRYYKQHTFKNALFWQISIILATLFRIEAISLLVGLPLVLLFNTNDVLKNKLKIYIKANSISIFILIAVLILSSIFKLISIDDLGRIKEVISLVNGNYSTLITQLIHKSDILGNQILGSYLDDYGLFVLCIGLISIVVLKIISTTGYVATLIIIVGKLTDKLTMSTEAKKVLIFAMYIHFINMLLIILSVYILSGRYVIGFSLVMIIFSGFYLSQLLTMLSQSKNNKFRFLIYTLLFILAACFIKIIYPKQEGYNYEQDAVAWIKGHNASNLPVFYVSPRARFYANQPYSGRGYDYWEYSNRILTNNYYSRYNFLVINIEKEHFENELDLIMKFNGYKKISEFFGSKKKKKIIILEKSNS